MFNDNDEAVSPVIGGYCRVRVYHERRCSDDEDRDGLCEAGARRQRADPLDQAVLIADAN